ncbi:MAG: ATP-binding cassette domain-containing protein, partial [Alphaproteobacteria bacterium]
MIELRDVTKTYHLGGGDVRALAGVTLSIEPGEFVAIMGPSGSGKSTLMHVLGILDVPSSGSYGLFGTEVSTLGDAELASFRSRTIGFVFQQFNLLSRVTALENVAVPMLYSANGADHTRARGLLEQVGLGDRASHRPPELSGGQQQRVAIARALVNEPRLILADEPTGNLDSASEGEILAILHTLHERGITVIVVTHEPEIAAHASRVIRMRDGRVLSDERSVRAGQPPPHPQALTPASIAHRPWRSRLRRVRAHFGEAARALLANKVRTSLSMLGILIGVGAVIAMIALGAGAQVAIQSTLSSLGSNLLVLRTGSWRS